VAGRQAKAVAHQALAKVIALRLRRRAVVLKRRKRISVDCAACVCAARSSPRLIEIPALQSAGGFPSVAYL
jgi:hypothetical protein